MLSVESACHPKYSIVRSANVKDHCFETESVGYKLRVEFKDECQKSKSDYTMKKSNVEQNKKKGFQLVKY